MEPFTPPQTFEGRSIAEAKEKAAAALGDDFVQIGEARWERHGGVGGFFEKRRVTISAQRADMIGRLARLPREADLQASPARATSEEDDEVRITISAAAAQAGSESVDAWRRVQGSQTATAAASELQTPLTEDDLAPGGRYEREYEQSLREQMERNPALLLTHEERMEVLRKNGIDLTRRPSLDIDDAPRLRSEVKAAFPPLESRPAAASTPMPVAVSKPFPELDMFEEETTGEAIAELRSPDSAQPQAAEQSIEDAPEIVEEAAPVLPPATPSITAEPPASVTAPAPAPAPPALTLATPSTAAAAVEAQLAPDKLRADLESQGVPKRLAAELVKETMLLGGSLMERKHGLQNAIIRRFKPAPMTELVAGPVLVICGERLSGKSGLTARMLSLLASSGREISVASIGPMDNPGVETVRAAASRAGAFFAWTNSPQDAMLKTLAKNSELLIIDLHAGDPARTKELQQIQQLKRSLPGKVHLLGVVPSDAPSEYLIEQVSAWPTLAALAVTRADCADKPGNILALAAAQKCPIAFISQASAGGKQNSLRTFDPAAFARVLVS